MSKTGNTAKYLSYKEAWRRVKAAVDDGYYFEAVAIQEGMISDRISSYLTRIGKSTKGQNFSRLITSWCASVEGPISYKGGKDLSEDVDKWRKKRNIIIHGLVKSAPGHPTQNVDDFLEMAKLAAEEGTVLARAVCDWQKKMMRIKSP